MASWLKAAEDLFEVVDRRAKSVVEELSEEQTDLQLPASGRKGSQGKRTSSKKKARQKLVKEESSNKRDFSGDQSGPGVSQSEVPPSTDEASSSGPVLQTNEIRTDVDVQSVQSLPQSVADTKSDDAAVVGSESVVEGDGAESKHADGDIPNDSLVQPSPSLPDKEIEVAVSENLVDVPKKDAQRELDDSSKRDLEKLESVVHVPSVGEGNVAQSTGDEVKVGTSINLEKEQEPKVPDTSTNLKREQDRRADTTSVKIQDQLEEAQGLLKATVSTGQSKEARLARVCAGLSSRLQEIKAENAQLEELLTAEQELTKSYEASIRQLQKDLSAAKSEVTKVESSMVEALAAKNSEIETLVSAMDALKNQAALNEGKLSSLQGDMESIMRNRELAETRMMQALREELATTERRAEEERSAHNATKMAAMERERELEHRAVDASTALVRIQRIADERTAKVADLEQKVALLEAECTSLNQELQDMEVRARRGQKKAPDEANQVVQIQAWQDEVDRARQGQRDAEEKLSSMEAEMQKLRVEMAAMKRDAEHYSRQEHTELEKRYRELTDLLYYKQTQLETMASEKAAAEFQLEKEVKRLHEAQVEVERSRVSRRPSATWEEDSEIKTLEPLPLYHRHMATASTQLQNAVKLLDSGAVRATRFLWRYPIARIFLLFYLVFVHLFLMYLLHRLQEQAEAQEVAEMTNNVFRP
ncbi:Golgin subfamily A member 5 [Arabidopsis thaliana x Arabidopsis arenosa]|uniref:Golgin subfamily A member 5 n=1 Tax=Arabidopsis thaliana x Arabidopsis arenosa TaxID=1240361 RepID=A0A8T2B2D3_9BRAS|nr:Golgin subfamily A member 5 [Arabidopsis thaliana x Arabidopsis arenosa]